jgi:hypothetical protein
MKRTRRFRVICPNRMIGMGERHEDPALDELWVVAERWVTPLIRTKETYTLMAESLMEELERPPSAYTNSG